MQKLIVTHLFLNLYLLAIIQPVIPVLDYLLNYDFIAKELCINRDKPIQTCNGKCYLEKEVAKQQNLMPNSSKPLPPKIDLEKLLTLKTDLFTYQFSEILQEHEIPFFYKILTENPYAKFLFRPPSF